MSSTRKQIPKSARLIDQRTGKVVEKDGTVLAGWAAVQLWDGEESRGYKTRFQHVPVRWIVADSSAPTMEKTIWTYSGNRYKQALPIYQNLCTAIT